MVGDKAKIAKVQTVATISGMIPPPPPSLPLKKKSRNGQPNELDFFYEPLKEPLPKKESVSVLLINCAVC